MTSKTEKESNEFKQACGALYNNELMAFSQVVNGMVNINERDREGRTLLVYCILENNLEFMSILISKDIDVNQKDHEEWTALHYAAQDYNLEAARYLLKNGAVIDPQNSKGNTPLFTAVYNSRGRGAMIKLLLSYGADENLKNISQVSPKVLAHKIANYDINKFFSNQTDL